MKNILTSVFLMALTSTFSPSLKAQNLVPNPSFEIYDTCPNGGQINYAVGWSSYRLTPDYYNSCVPDTNNPYYSVPSNYGGFQYARTGNAYCGLATFASNILNGREYVGIQLNQSLIIGHKYYGSFYVSKAEKNRWTTATNKIGMRLSTAPYSTSNPEPINNHAQIYTDSIITDTVNWVRISSSFIADSAYRYLSIGNFFVDSLTSHVLYDTLVSTIAYYYIDDVYISDIPDSNSEGISTGYKNNFIKIIPNPARDWITFEGKSAGKFFLYDVLGKICCVGEVAPSILVKINVSEYNKGIYFLNIQSSMESITQKVIIQ